MKKILLIVLFITGVCFGQTEEKLTKDGYLRIVGLNHPEGPNFIYIDNGKYEWDTDQDYDVIELNVGTHTVSLGPLEKLPQVQKELNLSIIGWQRFENSYVNSIYIRNGKTVTVNIAKMAIDNFEVLVKYFEEYENRKNSDNELVCVVLVLTALAYLAILVGM